MPVSSRLVLGETTEADVISQLGTPGAVAERILPTPSARQLADVKSAFDAVPAEGIYRRLGYYYLAGVSTSRTVKEAYFTFWNGKLVSYDYNSNTPGAAANFEAGRLGQIIRGVTTRQEIFGLFGEPTGETVYPMIADRQGRLISYKLWEHSDARVENVIGDDSFIRRTLEVLIDAGGKVAEFRYKSDVTSGAMTPWSVSR